MEVEIGFLATSSTLALIMIAARAKDNKMEEIHSSLSVRSWPSMTYLFLSLEPCFVPLFAHKFSIYNLITEIHGRSSLESTSLCGQRKASVVLFFSTTWLLMNYANQRRPKYDNLIRWYGNIKTIHTRYNLSKFYSILIKQCATYRTRISISFNGGTLFILFPSLQPVPVQ